MVTVVQHYCVIAIRKRWEKISGVPSIKYDKDF
jgi:hypothetical protein